MIVFINGGSGSGKSAFAEKVAVHYGGKLIYVATMPVFSKEDERKVERHHKLRAGKGFETFERPKLLENLPAGKETLLIECMSTHTANMIYDPEILPEEKAEIAALSYEEQKDALFALIRKELQSLLKRQGSTVFVSAEVAQDGIIYDKETELYKTVLTKVNRWLMEQADAGFEVVCGIPIQVKGDLCV